MTYTRYANLQTSLFQFVEGKTLWSSGKGQDSRLEVFGLNPSLAVEAIYHASLIWIKSMKSKLWKR